MAYDDIPRKPIEIRDGRKSNELYKSMRESNRADHTEAGADKVGYMGVDNLDTIRRENLVHKTK